MADARPWATSSPSRRMIRRSVARAGGELDAFSGESGRARRRPARHLARRAAGAARGDPVPGPDAAGALPVPGRSLGAENAVGHRPDVDQRSRIGFLRAPADTAVARRPARPRLFSVWGGCRGPP